MSITSGQLLHNLPLRTAYTSSPRASTPCPNATASSLMDSISIDLSCRTCSNRGNPLRTDGGVLSFVLSEI